MLERELVELQHRLKAPLVTGIDKNIRKLMVQLHEYFGGKRREFDIPLCTPGTPFQQKVWEALQDIPYGQTRSYLRQAEELNMKSAVRAVAGANGANRVAIIIPCHRVIGADSSLGGYGGGLERKRFLLDLETTKPLAR